MKKVLVLLLLLSVACGGSIEETALEDTTTTTVQDTTTTTIPPLPTIGFDIIENYNLKLVDELCLGSESIDTVTESCLKQYREDLEWLTRYNDQIQEYVNELNQYFEQYPEQLTEEYSSYLSFVENEYSAVFTDYEIVSDKYIERFGGVPVISNFFSENELWNECSAIFNIEKSENVKSGSLIYTNNSGEFITFEIQDENFVKSDLKVKGGKYFLQKAILKNYLDESFEIKEVAFSKNIYIKHWNPVIESIKIIDFDNESITIEAKWEDGVLKLASISVGFKRTGLNETNFYVFAATMYGQTKFDYESDYNFSYTDYLAEEENRIVFKHSFYESHKIELDSKPFFATNLFDYYGGSFLQLRSDNGDLFSRRKVGCSGENSVENIENSDVVLYDLSKLVFNNN